MNTILITIQKRNDIHQSFLKAVKKKAFDIFDRNKNGKVDFKEFCQSLSICCKSDINAKIHILFIIFDTDSDKFISKAEMLTLLRSSSAYIFKSPLSPQIEIKNEPGDFK